MILIKSKLSLQEDGNAKSIAVADMRFKEAKDNLKLRKDDREAYDRKLNAARFELHRVINSRVQ